jgi:hypothetical protein
MLPHGATPTHTPSPRQPRVGLCLVPHSTCFIIRLTQTHSLPFSRFQHPLAFDLSCELGLSPFWPSCAHHHHHHLRVCFCCPTRALPSHSPAGGRRTTRPLIEDRSHDTKTWPRASARPSVFFRLSSCFGFPCEAKPVLTLENIRCGQQHNGRTHRNSRVLLADVQADFRSR